MLSSPRSLLIGKKEHKVSQCAPTCLHSFNGRNVQIFIKLTLFCFVISFKLVIDDSVAMTPFYLLLGKHRHQQQENEEPGSILSAEQAAPPQSSVAIREVCSSTARASSPCPEFVPTKMWFVIASCALYKSFCRARPTSCPPPLSSAPCLCGRCSSLPQTLGEMTLFESDLSRLTIVSRFQTHFFI